MSRVGLTLLVAAGCGGPTLVAQPDARPVDDAGDTAQAEAETDSSGQPDAAAGDDAAPDATPSSGGAWTDLTPPAPLPAAWPSARSTHAMAYDSARDRIVVFAGVVVRRVIGVWC